MRDSNSIIDDNNSNANISATPVKVAEPETVDPIIRATFVRKSIRTILEYGLVATGMRPNAVEISRIQTLLVEFVETGAVPQEIADATTRANNEKVTLANPVIMPPMAGMVAQKLDDIKKILNS